MRNDKCYLVPSSLHYNRNDKEAKTCHQSHRSDFRQVSTIGWLPLNVKRREFFSIKALFFFLFLLSDQACTFDHSSYHQLSSNFLIFIIVLQVFLVISRFLPRFSPNHYTQLLIYPFFLQILKPF